MTTAEKRVARAIAPTLSVLSEVADERRRQDKKWGDQSHQEDGTSHYFRERADHYRRECDEAKRIYGAPTFANILLEETFEALSELDPAKLRAELVQVAAVCVAWCEAIDRRRV